MNFYYHCLRCVYADSYRMLFSKFRSFSRIFDNKASGLSFIWNKISAPYCEQFSNYDVVLIRNLPNDGDAQVEQLEAWMPVEATTQSACGVVRSWTGQIHC